MLKTRVKTKSETGKVLKKVEKANFNSLGHAGGAIRLAARRSIRRSKNPSAPGRPPHTRTGNLKRALRYAVTGNEVVIGPVNEFGGPLFNLHEFGGRVRGRRQLKTHSFSPGEFGPVERRAFRFVRAKLVSQAQADRATRLNNEENARRRTEVRNYPRRPFMGPALETVKDRLPKFWADAIR